jgi:elongator complex protein 3
VQHLDNEVLDFNGREMTRESIAKATEILRAAGFKFVYHMMPNLPKSNEEMDIKMFRDLYDTKDFHPDMLKVYPNMILKTTLLYKMFTQKKDFVIAKKLKSIAKKECKTFNEDDIPTFDYQPYDDEKLIRVLAMCEREIKNYTRVIRMIRDIPATYILASSKKSNMRELVDQYQKENGFLQQDIRSREVRDLELDIKDFNLRDTIYETQHGEEHFIEYINEKDSDKIAGFVRLRLQDGYFDKELNNFENLKSLSGKCALIRELHVYGTVKKINEEGSQSQHIGFGKRLMAEAERVAKEKGYKKVAVIAGVGVRKYYEKIGYKLENTYMIKYL